MRTKTLGIAFVLLASLAAAQSVVPVFEEPRHRLVVKTVGFHVLNVLIPPGDTTLYHRHAEPTLYINLQRTAVRAQRLDEEWAAPSDGTGAPGGITVNDDLRNEPFAHRVNNVGDRDFHLMLISNDRDKRMAPDLDVISRMPGAPGVDSEFFAQSRIDLDPGKSLDWNGVRHQVIFVLVTDSHVVIHGKGGRSFEWGMLGVGAVEFMNANNGFQFENRSDVPAIVIAVAVR